MNKKFSQIKWEWDEKTGATVLTNLAGPGSQIYIVPHSETRRELVVDIGSGDQVYYCREQLKPTRHSHSAEKQATARVKYHIGLWVRQEKKKTAAVIREAKDILKRINK